MFKLFFLLITLFIIITPIYSQSRLRCGENEACKEWKAEADDCKSKLSKCNQDLSECKRNCNKNIIIFANRIETLDSIMQQQEQTIASQTKLLAAKDNEIAGLKREKIHLNKEITKRDNEITRLKEIQNAMVSQFNLAKEYLEKITDSLLVYRTPDVYDLKINYAKGKNDKSKRVIDVLETQKLSENKYRPKHQRTINNVSFKINLFQVFYRMDSVRFQSIDSLNKKSTKELSVYIQKWTKHLNTLRKFSINKSLISINFEPDDENEKHYNIDDKYFEVNGNQVIMGQNTNGHKFPNKGKYTLSISYGNRRLEFKKPQISVR